MLRINVGAYIGNKRPATKKALREALANAPETVQFDGTSLLGPQFGGGVDKITPSISLNVCGPDPYRSRKWFATVTRDGRGRVRIT